MKYFVLDDNTVQPFVMFSKTHILIYLLGLAGTTQALITPDLIQGFPTYQFYQFFISHGLIIFSALFMTLVHDYRPSLEPT